MDTIILKSNFIKLYKTNCYWNILELIYSKIKRKYSIIEEQKKFLSKDQNRNIYEIFRPLQTRYRKC